MSARLMHAGLGPRPRRLSPELRELLARPTAGIRPASVPPPSPNACDRAIIGVLAASPERMTAREIAARSGYAVASIRTRMVLLTRRGLVDGVRHSSRQPYRYSLSASGRAT